MEMGEGEGPFCLCPAREMEQWALLLPYIRSGPPWPSCLAERHNGVYMREAR
jgi:hypothetical protein